MQASHRKTGKHKERDARWTRKHYTETSATKQSRASAAASTSAAITLRAASRQSKCAKSAKTTINKQEPCATISNALEMSRADTLAAKSVHLSHLRRVKEVEATVSKAKDHAEQLTTLKLEHQKTYVKLRNEILGEMTHTANHLKKYKQARKMAIKYIIQPKMANLAREHHLPK